VIYLPFLQNVLSTDSLPVMDLLIGLGVSLLVLPVAELIKWFGRRK
jgi:hypothetical protein